MTQKKAESTEVSVCFLIVILFFLSFHIKKTITLRMLYYIEHIHFSINQPIDFI